MSAPDFDADENTPAPNWTAMDLVFLGFNSRVIALSRETGEIVWEWKSPKGRGSYVALLLDGDLLIASVQGYTYCLDPRTGNTLWNNPLKGKGLGVPAMVSLRGNSGSTGAAAVLAQQQAAAAAGAG